MTEDAKPGLNLSLENGDDDRGDDVEFDVADVLKDYGFERLTSVDRYESAFDDGDYGATDRGAFFDDGSAF